MDDSQRVGFYTWPLGFIHVLLRGSGGRIGHRSAPVASFMRLEGGGGC